MAIRTRKMVAVTLETGSGNTVVVEPIQSDWQISGLEANQMESIPVQDRGTYQEAVLGDDTYPEWSLTQYHDGTLSHAVTAKVQDIVMHDSAGSFSADVTTDPGGQAWHLKATIVVTHPGGGVDTYVCANCRVTYDYAAAKEGNTLALSGTCYRDTGVEAVVLTSA